MTNANKIAFLFSLILLATFLASLSACNQQDTVAPIGVASPTFPSVNSVARSEPATPQAQSTASRPTAETELNLLTSGTVIPTQTARPTLNPTAMAEREAAIRNDVDAIYLIPEEPDQLEYILQPEHLVSRTAQQEWGVSVATTSSWDEAQQILDAGSAKALIVHHAAAQSLNPQMANRYFFDQCIITIGIGLEFDLNWPEAEITAPAQFFITSAGIKKSTGSVLYGAWEIFAHLASDIAHRDPTDRCKTIKLGPKPPATSTFTAKQPASPSSLDGLILSGSDGWDNFSIIRNGERTELTPSDYLQLKHSAPKLNRAVLDGAWLFSIGNDGDIFVHSGEYKSRFWGDEALKTQYIWGIMSDWLMVSTVQADRFGQQAITDLTAIALDGSGIQVIGRGAHISPDVSPDGSRVVFTEDKQVFTWSPDVGRASLPLEWYSTARFSPNGRYIAFAGESLSIFDFETNQTIISNEANIVGTHGLEPPIWSPTSDQVAIQIWDDEQTAPVAIRLVTLDGTANDLSARSGPMFSPDGKLLATIQHSETREVAIIDLTTQEEIILPVPDVGPPVAWIDLNQLSSTAAQPENESQPSPAEGLILMRLSSNPTYSIFQDGKSRSLDRYSAAVWLDNTSAQSFLAKQAVYNQTDLFIVEDNQLFKVVGEQKTLIYDKRPVSAVFGIIDDRVIVSSLTSGEERTHYIGSLIAIAVDGSAMQIMKREQSNGIPVIDKFRDRLIYVQDDYVETWYSDNRTEVLPFKLFRSGSVSPDGRFAALRSNNQINIYDLETNQILHSHKFEIANGDGFDLPVWNGSSEKVSFGVGHIESYYPYAVQIISIADGAVQSINGASNQAFSPDGDHMAVYQVSESDGSSIAIVDLQTEERQTLSGNYSGIPAGWVNR